MQDIKTPNSVDMVVLVDQLDNAIGAMEKLEAHEKGILHRAFSIFIFNKKGEMLLQQRAKTKYHSPGLWTNTCCSHPRPNEEIKTAAQRRLVEEMGMTTELFHKGSFIYKAKFDNDLTEHEFDHIFTGESDTDPLINKEEVETFRWLDVTEIKKQIIESPNEFTVWFKIALEKFF